jgi:nitrogen fixation NifU-like protein
MSAAPDLKTLYRQTVLDHSRHPRNFRRIENCERTAEGHNPLCGDKVTIYLRISGDEISDISFEGTGCAICIASASILTEAARGKNPRAAERLAQQVIQAFAAAQSRADTDSQLGDMAALAGVRAYPSRIKCATLAWHTLHAALHEDSNTVTTE